MSQVSNRVLIKQQIWGVKGGGDSFITTKSRWGTVLVLGRGDDSHLIVKFTSVLRRLCKIQNSVGWRLVSLPSLFGTVWLRLCTSPAALQDPSCSHVRWCEPLWQTGSSCEVADCDWTMLEGHRMELSGGRVLGLQPVSRKSWTVVHCSSKWPLRVQCDGQFTAAAHTGSLCWGSWTFSLTQCYTH